MKNKPVVLLSLLLVLVLTSCASQSETAGKPADTGDPTPGGQQAPLPVTSTPGHPFLPGYHDDEIYVSLANEDCDFYENSPYLLPGLSFKILSVKELGKNNIHVNLPMKTSHTVEIRDDTAYYHTLENRETGELGEFRYWHYLMMQKPDWNYLAQVKQDENTLAQWDAEHHAGQERWERTDPEEIALDQRVFEGQLYEQRFSDAFLSFSAEEIPSFFVYNVSITIQGPFADETVDHVDLLLGEKSVSIPLGAWRFHRETPDDIAAPDSYGLRQEALGVMSIEGTFCDGGYALISDAFSFTVGQDDLTVIGAHAYPSDSEVIGAHVRLLTADQATASDYYWDMQSPLDFSAGQAVAIDVIIYNERLKSYEFNGTLYLSMEYEINGKTHCLKQPCFLKRSNDIIASYFALFEDVDLTQVYGCDMAGTGSLAAFPDEWRKH